MKYGDVYWVMNHKESEHSALRNKEYLAIILNIQDSNIVVAPIILSEQTREPFVTSENKVSHRTRGQIALDTIHEVQEERLLNKVMEINLGMKKEINQRLSHRMLR